MFEHSVRVPRHFKIAANIFKKVSTEGGSVKTLLYDDKLRHFRTNVLYALITETIKHAEEIDKIFKCSGFLEAETRLDPWLAKVLTTEILFGKKELPGKSKPEQTILSYKDKFQTLVVENDGDLKSKVRKPRYVRICTNLMTTSDAIREFQDEGYKFMRCTSGSYDDYLQQIQGLTEYDFTQDYHVKTMFVFSSGTKFHDHPLYLENKIVLQDKATALAVHLLAPPPGSAVIDLCAAPGMKTTQLAAYLKNQGKIYAIERNEQRYQTLCEFVEQTGSKCVETVLKDSLEIRRGEYDDVEYILLDPSCSGSGMDYSVHNNYEDIRLAKLTSLQEKFLKHAMNCFPKAKRIVYSTCSLFPEENERVITNVVKTSRAKWRVQEVKELLKGQWNNFGSGMYGSMGTRCLYAKPDEDFTIGFFLAVLDRDQKDLEKSQCVNNEAGNEVESRLNTDDKNIKNETEFETNAEKLNDLKGKAKILKKEKKSFDNSESVANENVSDLETYSKKQAKKSKKRKNVEVTDRVDESYESNIQGDKINEISDVPMTNILDEETELLQPKKKKKKRDKNLEVTEIDDNDNANLDESFISGTSRRKKKDRIEETISNTEKSKKNKNRENLEIIIKEEFEDVIKEDKYYTNEMEKTMPNVEISEKSKKKKQVKNLEVITKKEDLDNGEKGNKNVLEVFVNTATSEKSKKMKKEQHLEVFTREKDTNCKKKDKIYTNDVQETICHTEKSKKKKKRKNSETPIYTEQINNIGSVDEVKKKKKRNKEVTIEIN